MFNPSQFVEEIRPQVYNVTKGEKVVAAVSGGVDSTTAAALMYTLLGDKVIPVMLDTGFLRKGEAEKVKEMLKNVMPLEVINVEDKFFSALEGKKDAEEKRHIFRDLFYESISEIVKRYNASALVQGTIAADWVETQGGIKTQHNVLVQMGIDTQTKWGFKLIEPLADLYKNEVRELARFLGLPKDISERQPFPGPGLLIRSVGELTREKLEVVREATGIVEKYLEGMASQYFAVVIQNKSKIDREISSELGKEVTIYSDKATGVKGDVRSYGKIAGINVELNYPKIRDLVSKITRHDITHVGIKILSTEKGNYSVIIRAVKTEDFMTADFVELNEDILISIAKELVKIRGVAEVLYDVTSKPPATIEFE
ncbi:ATP-binding protein [Candidatus Acidianus copahuensis]|uniref:GMP synthase (glutamine-hydrolyzing) n=1 Tax=Candidatus Acidianus copahuensis TaxID=1160895 RepID=A0A031LR52_9CREN|nr:ATP-binding protein [Candidatus Acidianus copahuensis]EZQ10862.1 GMP synthase [Candidatus Acidianus copahuensis]NON62006.1 GMP synthase [Acidianus sp. RZ1]